MQMARIVENIPVNLIWSKRTNCRRGSIVGYVMWTRMSAKLDEVNSSPTGVAPDDRRGINSCPPHICFNPAAKRIFRKLAPPGDLASQPAKRACRVGFTSADAKFQRMRRL